MFSSSSSRGGGGGGGGIGGGGGGGGGGCGCGSNGNGGGSGVWSSGIKKQQKRPKVPKRGPGVAELEKILREQEKSDRGININNISSNSTNNAEGFPVSPSCFNLHHHSSPPLKPHCPPPPPPPVPVTAATSCPPPPPPPPHIPIAPRFDHLSQPPPPPMAALYGYNTATQGRNFPEQSLFPMNPSSCDGLSHPDHHHHSANPSSKNFCSESSNNHLWPYSALPQKRHCNNRYHTSMMRQVLGPTAPPPSSSLLPAGLHNHEPPSNQSSYFNCTSRNVNPEEPKMVGLKRPHPSSSFENSLVPSSTFQVSPIFSNFTRPHKSSNSNDTHITSSNFNSSNNECFRDVKWGGPLGYSSRKFGSDSNGGLGHHSNFSSFNGTAAASPPVPSPSMLMFQRESCKNNNALPNYQVLEERMEDSYQRSESSSGSDQRPFYNFLEVKEVGMKENTLGSNHKGSEVGIDGPDLTLKLW
ncbi:uncharacterized protein LOC129300066 [Prosopis cineraria]|uniref:uncharacterized protein LOC129300066 n=1 Tax=Prosopis cineraria TaxID=364024 RepID=UPI00241040F8|nr:uncharacterized protein LOC129300066 [Prosopis cineraria]